MIASKRNTAENKLYWKGRLRVAFFFGKDDESRRKIGWLALVFYVVLSLIIYRVVKYKKRSLRLLFATSAIPLIVLLGYINLRVFEELYPEAAEVATQQVDRSWLSLRERKEVSRGRLAVSGILLITGALMWMSFLRKKDD